MRILRVYIGRVVIQMRFLFVLNRSKIMSNKKRIGKYLVLLDQKLGKGASAEVCLGINEETKEPVAVKIMSKQKIREDEYTMNAFYSQIQIMRKFKSKNIIGFMDVNESNNNFYIILQLANEGTLRNRLHHSGRMEQGTAIKYLMQLLNGFGELAKNGVIHRDLKPDNIFISNNQLKIGDFGFAKHSMNNSFMKSIVGTPAYMAPQILAGEQYSYKCDIWSLGVIAYEFLVGTIPWTLKEKNLKSIAREVKNKAIQYPPDVEVSPDMRDFIQRCLQIDECNRMDWEQLFQHKLFGGKFNAYFEKKKKGSTQMNFILAELRMNIHSNNLNLTKILNKVGKQFLDSRDFHALLRILDRTLSEEDIDVVYKQLEDNNVVSIDTFQQLLKKHGFRMTGLDLSRVAKEREIQEEMDHSTQYLFQAINLIKRALESQQISLENHLKTAFMRYRNGLSINQFNQLIKEIQPSLTHLHVECLFKEFNTMRVEKISLNQYYAALCKVGEDIYTPMEVEE